MSWALLEIDIFMLLLQILYIAYFTQWKFIQGFTVYISIFLLSGCWFDLRTRDGHTQTQICFVRGDYPSRFILELFSMSNVFIFTQDLTKLDLVISL